MADPVLSNLQSDGSADLLPGSRLGKYELIRRLSVGGMAEIFLARAHGLPGFQVNVAIKRILPQLAAQPEFVEMFLDEARIAATLQHPHIVQILDVAHGAGSHFIAMEYLHGEDVNAILRTAYDAGRRVPTEHVLQIMMALLSGLHYAHEKESEDGRPLHVVHCDVSPGNLIVTYEGGIKLVDFGIATAQLRAAAKGSGQVQGKIGYMSPEQARGERCDRRTDVYAAGVMLYELSLGRRLYKGNNDFHILNRLMAGDFARPCEVDPTYDPALEAIVLRALSSERVERFPTALAMQQELEVYARQRGVFMSSSSLKNFMGELFAKKIADARRMRRFTDGVPIPPNPCDTTAPDMPSPVPERNAPTAMLTPDPSGEVMTLPPSVAAELDVFPSGRSGRVWRGAVAVGVAALLALVAIAVRTPTSVPAPVASTSTLAPLIAAAASAGAVASPSRAVAAVAAVATRSPSVDDETGADSAKGTAPSRRASSGSNRSRHEPKRATAGSNARFGALTLSSNPGCEVTVDGKPRGQTPLTLSLPPGTHKISISNRKLSIKRQLSVAIKPGEVVTKALDFSEYL